jgi:hypothetical protein
MVAIGGITHTTAVGGTPITVMDMMVVIIPIRAIVMPSVRMDLPFARNLETVLIVA